MLNEFLSDNHVSPKVIYTYFEEEQLAEFMVYSKDCAKAENRTLGKFKFIENKETKNSDPSNTKPGISYKYFGESSSHPDKRSGLGFCTWGDGSTYQGHWETDKKHGMGTENWKDGANY